MSLHVNGQANVSFNAAGDARVTAASSYSGNTAVGSGYGSCTATYCHSNGTDTTAPYDAANSAPATALVWGATGDCGDCHGDGANSMPGYADGTPKANKHPKHVTANPYGCQVCHYTTTTTGTTITAVGNHANRVYTADDNSANNPALDDFTYAGGTCTATNCHGGNSGVALERRRGHFTCDVCHAEVGGVATEHRRTQLRLRRQPGEDQFHRVRRLRPRRHSAASHRQGLRRLPRQQRGPRHLGEPGRREPLPPRGPERGLGRRAVLLLVQRRRLPRRAGPSGRRPGSTSPPSPPTRTRRWAPVQAHVAELGPAVRQLPRPPRRRREPVDDPARALRQGRVRPARPGRRRARATSTTRRWSSRTTRPAPTARALPTRTPRRPSPASARSATRRPTTCSSRTTPRLPPRGTRAAPGTPATARTATSTTAPSSRAAATAATATRRSAAAEDGGSSDPDLVTENYAGGGGQHLIHVNFLKSKSGASPTAQQICGPCHGDRRGGGPTTPTEQHRRGPSRPCLVNIVARPRPPGVVRGRTADRRGRSRRESSG